MGSIDDDDFGSRGDGAAMNWLERGEGGNENYIPQFIKVDPPVAAVGSLAGHVRVQGNINGFSAVEGNGRKVLVKERLEHNDLIALVQEGGEYRVLTWQGMNTVSGHCIEDGTFVSTTGDYNLGLDIKRPFEGRFVKVFDGIAQAYAPLWVGVVVGQSLLERLICSINDPRGRGEVHVPLTEIDAVGREICGAAER